jgi:hypothetical protein
MAYPDDLLKDAYASARRGGTSPRQSALRRAVSTGYYAAFHLFIEDFVANWPVPEQRARLGRMFEHRRMSGAPFTFGDKKKPTPVEEKLKQLIEKFAQLQNDRYDADYNIGRNRSQTVPFARARTVFHGDILH